MRTLQQLFDLAIENGYYHTEHGHNTYGSSSFMCIALDYLADDLRISPKERDYAIRCIEKYIGEHLTLVHKLVDMNRPYTCEYTLKIYQNWKNRPRKSLKCRE